MRRVATLSVLLALTASAIPVRAAEPAAASAPDASVLAARDAFRRGSALAKAGDWGAALAAFEESERLKPHPVTTYDIAYCERALGHYARASVRFTEALAPAADGAPALPDDLVHDATIYLDEVARRVVRVTVTRRPPALAIRVDGKSLERASSSAGDVYVESEPGATPEPPPEPFELWLDPGTHVFVVSGDAEARSVESRTFAAGESARVTLALPESATRPVASGRAPLLDGGQQGPDRTVPYVAFAVAGVGLAGSIVLGALALSEKHSLDADPECKAKRCPESYSGRESRMVTFADVATGGLVTFAAGAAVGSYFWFTASPSRVKAARVVPWFAGNAAGIAGRF